MRNHDDGPSLEDDEAVAAWTAATIEAVRPTGQSSQHIPFYKLAYYPDVLDLRKAGYEVSAFAELFDQLDQAHVRHGIIAHQLLHLPSDAHGQFGDGSGGNMIWTPRRARELEFQVRAALHRFGLSEVPTILRRMIGKAYPGDTVTHIAVDLLNVFFWAALGQVARDFAWRSPQLAFAADYLQYPVKRSFAAAK
jgi:hypothetical protein